MYSYSSRGVFPEDIWFEVLLKAPVEDVAKYRRLSKFHRNLIDSPDFIQKHNDLSIKTNRPHLIFSSVYNCNTYTVDQRVDLRRASNLLRQLSPPIKRERFWCNKSSKLLDSCMGILCYELVELSNCLFLWNPLTGSSRAISLKSTKARTKYCSFVLGHDHLTNDWVVLKMEEFKYFEIYSSKMNSWKVIQIGLKIVQGIEFGFLHDRYPIFVEGTNSMHWICSQNFILAYNFSTQEFIKFCFPVAPRFYPHIMSSLNGCLCLSMDISFDSREVWTMKKYGVEESWTRLYSISSLHNHSLRHCYGNQLVYIISDGDELHLYNVEASESGILTTELQEKLNFKLLRLEESPPQVIVFTPTLRKP